MQMTAFCSSGLGIWIPLVLKCEFQKPIGLLEMWAHVSLIRPDFLNLREKRSYKMTKKSLGNKDIRQELFCFMI